jgi:hypothetical protein|tara:strand:+ start:507 stop:641 length:135 start_codon:yes stop_codon:yes gene_type:complete
MYSTSNKFVMPTSDPDVSGNNTVKQSTFNGRISPARNDNYLMSH